MNFYGWHEQIYINRSINSNANGNLFYSSRNGSNASASSSSGGSRYKRHLLSRPYSPAALVTTNQSNNSAKNHIVCSTSAPTSSGHFNKNNDSSKTWSIPVTEIDINDAQVYNKKSKDKSVLICPPTTTEPIVESPHTPSKQDTYNPTQVKEETSVFVNSQFPSKRSLILNNQNNAKNKIFNVDFTQNSFSRLQIEDYPVSPSETDILHDTNKIPPLSKIGSSYKSYGGEGSIPVTQDNYLSSDEQSLTSTVNAVRLGNGHCQRPTDLDVLNGDKRKVRGYVFHTFGHKSDSTH